VQSQINVPHLTITSTGLSRFERIDDSSLLWSDAESTAELLQAFRKIVVSSSAHSATLHTNRIFIRTQRNTTHESYLHPHTAQHSTRIVSSSAHSATLHANRIFIRTQRSTTHESFLHPHTAQHSTRIVYSSAHSATLHTNRIFIRTQRNTPRESFLHPHTAQHSTWIVSSFAHRVTLHTTHIFKQHRCQNLTSYSRIHPFSLALHLKLCGPSESCRKLKWFTTCILWCFVFITPTNALRQISIKGFKCHSNMFRHITYHLQGAWSVTL
jgi:hypothetical protein